MTISSQFCRVRRSARVRRPRLRKSSVYEAWTSGWWVILDYIGDFTPAKGNS